MSLEDDVKNFIDIDNLSEEELDKLQNYLNNRKKRERYEKNIESINNHREYIGKCYKEKESDTYIRVLSAKSSNEFRVECMIFSFPIKFKEDHRFTKIFQPDNAFSEIEFEGIHVEDYPLFCNSVLNRKYTKVLHSLDEISEEEYFQKMNEYIQELQVKIKENFFDTSLNNKSMFEK